MSYDEHRQLSRDTPVRCAVLTVSDTRTADSDTSGALMKARLAEAGHEVAAYRIVPDEPAQVSALLDELAGTVEAILLNGGTGVSRRDNTYEAIAAKLEKTLPGFGEIFRMLSYHEIGSGAMLSRAIAGVYRDTVVFSTPGSANAVRLAMDKLIIPELPHLVWELARQGA
ncbi:MAG TPA: molybdenum cofactor biosynthesis protein B [Rhodothermales bacterium]|nr:molybdenum cofactor biosynthesis protein B [Rhodothermales bacterium]